MLDVCYADSCLWFDISTILLEHKTKTCKDLSLKLSILSLSPFANALNNLWYITIWMLFNLTFVSVHLTSFTYSQETCCEKNSREKGLITLHFVRSDFIPKKNSVYQELWHSICICWWVFPGSSDRPWIGVFWWETYSSSICIVFTKDFHFVQIERYWH